MTNHDQKKKINKFKVDVELGTHTHIYIVFSAAL